VSKEASFVAKKSKREAYRVIEIDVLVPRRSVAGRIRLIERSRHPPEEQPDAAAATSLKCYRGIAPQSVGLLIVTGELMGE